MEIRNIEDMREIIEKEPWEIVSEHGGNIENILRNFGCINRNGSVNLDPILAFPNLRKIISAMLGAKIEIEIKNKLNQKIDMVVSSSYSALLAEALSDKINTACAFTQNVNQVQKWTKRFRIPPSAHVLQVEGVVFSLDIVRQVKEAVLEKNPGVKFVKDNGKTIIAAVVSLIPEKPQDYKILALMGTRPHR